MKETPYAPNQEKEAYRVCHSSIPGASEQYAKRLQRRIWKDFLYRQRRWMSSPGGELRVTKDPVRDLVMEYHYEEFDGWDARMVCLHSAVGTAKSRKEGAARTRDAWLHLYR